MHRGTHRLGGFYVNLRRNAEYSEVRAMVELLEGHSIVIRSAHGSGNALSPKFTFVAAFLSITAGVASSVGDGCPSEVCAGTCTGALSAFG